MIAHKRWTALLFLALLLPALAGATTTQDWPQFRGSLQTGVTRAGVFDRPFGLEVAWKRPLGSGYSSISVVGSRGVTMTTDGTHDFLVAFDVETGNELWRYQIAEMYKGHSGSDDGPIGTPTVHAGTVYGLGPRGQLFAVRLEDGQQVWSHTFDGEKEARPPVYGYTTPPVWVDGVLVVETGGPGDHAISGFDPSTGKLLWSREDDTVSYQAPAVMQLGGRQQVVAVTDNLIVGLRPKTGEVLWKHKFATAQPGSGQPIALGEDRFLVNFGEAAAAYRLAGNALEELWRTTTFQGSFALPVVHEGHLYGFSGRFLTCVDPATGEAVWKSRPPGGKGLILVDGHLVMLAPNGELVVAEASPEAYREKTRLAVFDRDGYTPASFAGGRIFLRNLADMAAVRITRAPDAMAQAPVAPELPPLEGELGAWALRLEQAADKQRLIDEFFAAHASFPVIEEGGLVHFLYRGDAKDVAVGGSFLPFGEEEQLRQLAGTDLYARSYRLEPDAHYEYRFNVDFGTVLADPRNPHEIGSIAGPGSELRMPGFAVPAFVDAEPEGERGRLDSFELYSDILGGARRVQVYLPVGYGQGEQRYPLVIHNSGEQALTQGKIDRVLDNLFGHEAAPAVVVLLPRTQPEFGGEKSADYARMLAEELIPHLDKHYRTLAEPASRTIMGVGSGAFISTYAVLTTPGVYGKLSVQSFYSTFAKGEEFWQKLAAAEPVPIEIYLEQSPLDYRIGQLDAVTDGQRLAEQLKARGFSPKLREVKGSAGWGRWRSQLGVILGGFYPLPAKPAASG